MSSSTVLNILDVLKKSSDKNILLKALVKLRTDIVKDREGILLFKNSQGIPPLIKFLNRPNEKILDVVLSILGNACTNEECCLQAFENKIVPSLVTIIKSVPNPSIQCRACRLLGNLAKQNTSKFFNYNSSIAQSLCLILEESIESQTTLMGVRATKFLLSDKQFMKYFIGNDGFKIIIQILIKVMKKNHTELQNTLNENDVEEKKSGLKVQEHREKYFKEVARHLEGVRSDIFDHEILKFKTKTVLFTMPEEKGDIDIVNEILKCIHLISEIPSRESALELNNTLLSLPCIIFFSSENNPFRGISLKIISNFSRNPYAVAALSQADAVESACSLLMAENLEIPLTNSELRCCINSINVLAGDACNRAKIRRSGALKKLLEIAKESTSYPEVSMVLFTLINFQYDNMSIDFMLRQGLVGILVKELKAFLSSNDEIRKKKFEEKLASVQARKRKSAPETIQPNTKAAKWEDFYDEDSPVGSPLNLSPSSPCSSRSLSPISNCSKVMTGYDFDTETYSPVCSDEEGDSDDECNNIRDKSSEDCDVMKLLDIAFKSETNIEENGSDFEDEKKDTDHTTEKISSRNAIDIIDNLLFRVSLLVANRTELGQPETLNTILQAINVFGINHNSFGSSLTNILSDSKFFLRILKQDVPHKLYKMTRIDDLKLGGINFIDTLTCVAETGYGRGEIIKLLKYEPYSQKRCSIAVSFIIKNPRFMYSLLTEHDVLNILLTTILNKNDEFRMEAADGITSIAQTLGIKLPVSHCNKINFDAVKEFDESLDFLENNLDNDEMKFSIHRGCSQIPIKFSKSLLSQNSEVFNSMLNGDFRENKEGEVHLKGYTVHGIKYFLNLINLKSKNQPLNIPPVYYFDSILEAYELSRMYIMTDLEKKLFGMLIHRLDSKSCLRALEWSLKHFNPELSEIAINYYLSSEIDGKDKVDLYRDADYSKFSKEWYQMITDAILVKCQNLCVECS